MKSRFFTKSKLLFLLGLSCFIGPLSSCSAFFGGDEYTITDTQVTTDENGNTIVTITFSGEDIAPLTFTIPQQAISIDSVTSNLNNDNVTLTIKYTDSSKDDTVITIPVVKGDTGKGIENVEVGSDAEGNTTIVFAYSDGTKSDLITIPKGIDGKDGTGIQNITVNKTSTGVNEVVITFTDDTIKPLKFPINDGISIVDFYYDEATSTDDFYKIIIIFSDNSTRELELPRPQVSNWLSGTTIPSNNLGKKGDFYVNLLTGDVYTKLDGESWSYLFSIKGSGGATQSETYNVVFNLRDDEYTSELNPGSQTLVRVEEGETISLENIPVPIKDGYIFDGWYAGEDESNPNVGKFTNLTVVTSNLDLYARWTLE